MTLRLAGLCAALLLSACASPEPAAVAQPNSPPISTRMMAAADYVRTLYAAEPAWATDEEVRGLFAADLAEAIIADRKAHAGEVPSISFLFTCGCQDGAVTDVATTGVDTEFGSQVTATFKLEGQPRRIDYTLQRTERGWKIADVRAQAQQRDEAWSLRSLVGLPRLES